MLRSLIQLVPFRLLDSHENNPLFIDVHRVGHRVRFTAVDAQSLAPGSPAPEIKVAKWLKGTPVTAFEPGKIYVLECWATWCGPCKKAIPHITELAKKYKSKVTFIGVDIWEHGDNPLPAVEAFVQKMGDQMDYNIAYDGPENAMATQWLAAAKVEVIPTAFVVDGTGKIAWIGHQLKVEDVVQKILAGTWDITSAAKKDQLKQLDKQQWPSLQKMLDQGKFQGTLDQVNILLAKEPGLKYQSFVGFCTFRALCQTDPAKAVDFAKAWTTANDDPEDFGGICSVVSLPENHANKSLNLYAPEGIEQNLTQADTDAPSAPAEIAWQRDLQSDFYLRAGDRQKALASAKIALAQASSDPKMTQEQIRDYTQKVQSLGSSHATQP
jgi:thiol-disulfide isomerase/thioredoxin